MFSGIQVVNALINWYSTLFAKMLDKLVDIVDLLHVENTFASMRVFLGKETKVGNIAWNGWSSPSFEMIFEWVHIEGD